ncbi:metalloregulator ArsR/SmtB family transcription factor [Microbacterium deminutum]|uniref:Metalloregulator ArsR/SmtB family transcription factor n=1 Tax=Microbacterium deminutum TaxID=344164 RepID=A0ABN2RE17_9MICO
MENTTDAEIGELFGALADPTRRRLVLELRSGDATVGELAAGFAVGVAAISKHLTILQRAGVISRHKEAQWRRCRLEREPFDRLREWLDHYSALWDGSLDRLDDYLRESAPERPHDSLHRPTEAATP